MSTDPDNMPRPPPFIDPATAKGYELTGKIMMSAIIIVFAIVVLMVLLHIYARWYIIRNHRRGRRRRTHLVFYVDPNSASDIASFPSRGLDPSLLKSLPTFAYSSSANPALDDDEEALECAVCLSEFVDGEKGRLLPKCNHKFHVECIDMWFHSHSTCPLCRTEVDGEFPDQTKEIDIVVELSESNRGESTQPESGTTSSYYADCRPGPSSSSSSSSFSARRKGLDLVGVSVEVPRRNSSFSFANSDELSLSSPAGYKSPTSRLRSFRRILSRENRPIPSPSSSSSGIGPSYAEFADIEDGRVETRTSRTRATTPR